MALNGTMVNFDGKYVWIKSTDLVKEKIKYAYTGMTLNNAINIQSRLKYKTGTK